MDMKPIGVAAVAQGHGMGKSADVAMKADEGVSTRTCAKIACGPGVAHAAMLRLGFQLEFQTYRNFIIVD